jgi:hypothetical protein
MRAFGLQTTKVRRWRDPDVRTFVVCNPKARMRVETGRWPAKFNPYRAPPPPCSSANSTPDCVCSMVQTLWAQPKSSGLGPIRTLVGNCSNIRGGGTGHASTRARYLRRSSGPSNSGARAAATVQRPRMRSRPPSPMRGYWVRINSSMQSEARRPRANLSQCASARSPCRSTTVIRTSRTGSSSRGGASPQTASRS